MSLTILESLSSDTRYALRRLARDWQFSLGAVLVLALGIGANTAIFSVINTAMFRPSPFEEPDRLVDIYQNLGDTAFPMASSFAAFEDMAAYTDVFESVAAFSPPGLPVGYQTDDGRVQPVLVEFASSGYLPVLGLEMTLGRWFDAEEDRSGADAVAVVGFQTWSTRFDADPSIVGRTLRMNGAPVRIVGIGPSGYGNSWNAGFATDFWLSFSTLSSVGRGSGIEVPDTFFQSREATFLMVKGRLREGVSVSQAQAAMDVLGDRLAEEYPEEDPGHGISVLGSGEVRVHPMLDVALLPSATLLLSLVGLVLAIACSNLATMVLVRGASRSKEVSVRLALGATRAQLVRHLLIESLLLSAAAGIAGYFMAVRSIAYVGLLDLPFIVDLSLDHRVLFFAMALSLVTGLGFGLAPALRSTKPDLIGSLHDEGPALSLGRSWFSLKNALVVAQVTVSFLLLLAAGTVVRGLVGAETADRGMGIEGIALLETEAVYAGYDMDERQAVYEDLGRRIEAIPGVESVALSHRLPLAGPDGAARLVIDGYQPVSGESASEVLWAWASPHYFEALETPVLRGRAFDERDGPDAPRVAVINETMARRFFSGLDAVGGRFRVEEDADSWMEVVGIVPDGRWEDPNEAVFFRPFAQPGPETGASPATRVVLARGRLAPGALVGSMQGALGELDPGLPVITAQTMDQYLQDRLAVSRAVGGVLTGLGLLGLALAGVGLYAVVAYGVARRSREVGIRMALGARHYQVVWLMARDVTALVGLGVGLGVGLSLSAAPAIRFLFSRVADTPGFNLDLTVIATDPMAVTIVTFLMAASALLAAWLPARRAARADPMTALRHD